MKTYIINFVLVLIILLFTSCDKTFLTEPTSIDKGEYSGTFSVTYKRYQNTNSLTQTGKLSIIFYDSTYDYSATVKYSTGTNTYSFLKDNGRYSKSEANIIMNDDSWEMMDPRWHNSLYLFDTFNIKYSINKIEISQDNDFANWQLNLIVKNDYIIDELIQNSHSDSDLHIL